MINIGELADLHVGSMFGLWPENFASSTRGVFELNIGQKYLLENWNRIAKQIPPLDLLILNGDIIDGVQRKSEGLYICEPNMQFQMFAAMELLEPFLRRVRRGGEIYSTEGTTYHEGTGSKWCNQLAKDIDAVPMADNQYCWDWLLLDVQGKHFDIAHHQSHAIVYKSSIQEREMNYAEMQKSHADILIRSHNHVYSWLEIPREDRVQFFLSTPPWQLQSHYVRKSYSPNMKLTSQLGMIVVTIDKRGEMDKKRFLFPHPPMRRGEYVKARLQHERTVPAVAKGKPS